MEKYAETLIKFVKEVGFPIAVAVYFFVKDWYFTTELVALQTKTVLILQAIERSLQP
jgi:hypothetical protein